MRHLALRSFASLGSVLALVGCNASFSNSSPSPTPVVTYSGHVHGGEQPVTGALIQLYAVGTAGDGSRALPLIGSTVTTDRNGNFSITGLYNCSTATDVFLLASGGKPGLSTSNPDLTLMAALGPCSSLTPQTFISVNELTTVAAVYALAPFMTSATHIGSSPQRCRRPGRRLHPRRSDRQHRHGRRRSSPSAITPTVPSAFSQPTFRLLA